MWFLSFLPDSFLQWFIHGLVFLGVVLSIIGFIGKNIPLISNYGLIIKSIGSIMLIVGIFFEGGLGVEMSYRARIAEMQKKVAIAEAKSKEANADIEKKVAAKVKNIKDNVNANRQKIEENRTAINADCKLSDTAWMLYNRASQNVMAGSTSKSNGTSR